MQIGRDLEAATAGALWKKMFLKVSQNSQENTCARVSYWKKDSGAGVFLWNLWNIHQWLFCRTPLRD